MVATNASAAQDASAAAMRAKPKKAQPKKTPTETRISHRARPRRREGKAVCLTCVLARSLGQLATATKRGMKTLTDSVSYTLVILRSFW